jgi:Tfp pilus assembly protein PilF
MADAEVQFRKVIELDPDNQAAVYYLAELYRTSSPVRTDEAIPLYQRAVAIDDQSFIGEQSANQLNALGASAPASIPSSSPQAEATP